MPSNPEVISSTTHAMPDILDRNWQTTAAIGLGVASGGVTGALMLTVFPAQTLVTGATIGSLAVAGQRRAEGKDPMFGLMARFDRKSDDKAKADDKLSIKKSDEKISEIDEN